ncbi:MAG: Rpn family recombination-promoting nuclease/putative transposase [Myxococcota bacterium]
MGEHDALFKRVFGVREHAAAELRSVLPPEVAERLDLDRLEPVPGSFVDDEMKHRHADLLYRGRIGTSALYVYFLLEHQSEPDPMMAHRMYRYVGRIWDAALRDQPQTQTLPIVLPLVVHHGPGGWRVGRSLHQLVDGLDQLPELAPYVPSMALLIDELTTIDNAALKARPLSTLPTVALWVLRDGRRLEVLARELPRWREELRMLYATQPEDLSVILRYLLRVTGDATFEDFRSVIIDVAPEMEVAMGTPADDLIEQGIKKGVEQGIKKGVEQGIKKGVEQGIKKGVEQGIKKGVEQGIKKGVEQGKATALRQTLENQLSIRFGPLSEVAASRIESASLSDLQSYLDRVLHADTCEEVLGL